MLRQKKYEIAGGSTAASTILTKVANNKYPQCTHSNLAWHAVEVNNPILFSLLCMHCSQETLYGEKEEYTLDSLIESKIQQKKDPQIGINAVSMLDQLHKKRQLIQKKLNPALSKNTTKKRMRWTWQY